MRFTRTIGAPASTSLDRTFDAVLLDWDEFSATASSDASRAVRARLRSLSAAGAVVAIVTCGSPVALARLLRPGRQGGLWVGSRSEPARSWAGELEELVELGIEPRGVVAISSSRNDPPGATRPDPRRIVTVASSEALALLDDQLQRRRTRRVPTIDVDPEWTLSESGTDPVRHRITESLFTLGAAGLATRGAVEEANPGSVPLVLGAGIYTGAGPGEHLLAGPDWTGLAIEPPPGADLRVLDLRAGCLARVEQTAEGTPLRTFRFASVTLPGVVALRAEAEVGRLAFGPAFRSSSGVEFATGRIGSRFWARTTNDHRGGMAAVASQHRSGDSMRRTLERLAAYVRSERTAPRLSEAAALLDYAQELGFDRLLADQRATWAHRWEMVNVRISGDVDAQLGIRFALFQLWTNASRHGELALGARGQSGTGYAGHVFWDTDVFVLPAMCSIDPAAAAAMVRYRIARLPAARARAAQEGRAGARFPWESAAAGEDVTPLSGSLGGVEVPILTGLLEEHITADVAWGAQFYSAWNGSRPQDEHLVLPLLADTARYWASRIRTTDDGRGHILGVIGPDEYHESVDDNAYTNVMARWNLRTSADALDRSSGATNETARWRALAESLVDGLDPTSGRYEQFAGYDALEPLLIADVATAPVAVDVLIGHERVRASQLIKQPDVLMLHQLVPNEVAAGSLAPNLDYYGPRTAHGSSLSPSITACLLARAGRADEALEYLRIALKLDVGDTTGMTAGGLHMANLAGIWQAILTGFAGVSVDGDALIIDPHLPRTWASLGLRFRCLGRHVRLDLTNDGVQVTVDRTLRVRWRDAPTGQVHSTAHLPDPTHDRSTPT